MYLSMLQFQCVSKLCRKTTNYCGRSCRNPSIIQKIPKNPKNTKNPKNLQITVFVPVKEFSFKAFKKYPSESNLLLFRYKDCFWHFCLLLRKVTVPYRDEIMSSDSSLAKNIFKKKTYIINNNWVTDARTDAGTKMPGLSVAPLAWDDSVAIQSGSHMGVKVISVSLNIE